jgi:molybdopterin-guanine dinucleotide biosynthesis protein B
MSDKAVIQVVGFKNSGKTTITCELIKRLTETGWKVGSIKHDAHHFEVDYPGKDTWLHRLAGAQVVAITSEDKTAIMEQRTTSLTDLLARIEDVDIVIVEGYKMEGYPKVVLLREENDIKLIDQATNIVAIAAWFPFNHPTIPVVSITETDQLFTIILGHINQFGGEYEKIRDNER